MWLQAKGLRLQVHPVLQVLKPQQGKIEEIPGSTGRVQDSDLAQAVHIVDP